MTSQGVEGIYNYLRVSDRLGTAGQPTREQISAIKAAGFAVVVNLDVAGSVPWSESEEVAQLGMDYIHIPVVWSSPQPEDLDRFFEVMDSHQDRMVFVHCAANMRVSAFIFLYRVLRQGVPPRMASEHLDRIWEPNRIWHHFIEDSLDRGGVTDPWSDGVGGLDIWK